MKKMNGCAIKENTIVLTKAFAKLAYTPGTAEFRYLAELHKAFPDFPIVQRTASKNEDKEKFTDLSVDRMEKFIKWFKGEKELEEFQNAKAFYKGTAGYYGKMKKWFLDKYKKEYLNADFSKVNKPDEEKPAEAPTTEETTELANVA
ncbi:MAG: hypothetical protein J6B95_05905 [Oscillospiraceae bacterium]|nr:hypothetical protein [Oscillospiraceae bacterium]